MTPLELMHLRRGVKQEHSRVVVIIAPVLEHRVERLVLPTVARAYNPAVLSQKPPSLPVEVAKNAASVGISFSRAAGEGLALLVVGRIAPT